MKQLTETQFAAHLDQIMELVASMEPHAKALGWDIMLIGDATGPTGVVFAEPKISIEAMKTKTIRCDLAEAMTFKGI